MDIIILLLVFAAAFILVRFISETAIPFFLHTYNRLHTHRTTELAEKLEDSFIIWEKKRMVLITFSPLIFAGLGALLLKNLLGAILGFLLGLGFPNLMAKIAKKRRIKKIQGQLVDSLMILTSSVKAGLSFLQAIEVLCEEMPLPISQEFNLILKENKWGVNLEESLRKLRRRIPLEEVNLIVSSILIARESGGDLPRVFARLVETIRNNIKLKEKVATLTLQGRLQGIIMMFLPVGFAYFIYRQNPEHFDVMLQSQLGRMLLVAAVFAQVLGMFFIKRISTIKI